MHSPHLRTSSVSLSALDSSCSDASLGPGQCLQWHSSDAGLVQHGFFSTIYCFLLQICIKNSVASNKFLTSQIDLSFQGMEMSLNGTRCRDIAGPFILLPVLLTNTAEEMLKNVAQFILTNGFKVANNGRRHTKVLEKCDPIAGCISCRSWHSIPQQLIEVFLRGIPKTSFHK